MEQDPKRRSCEAGAIQMELWKRSLLDSSRSHDAGAMGKEPWGRSNGEGAIGKEPWETES